MKRTIRLNKRLFNSVYLPYLRDTRRVQIFFGGSSSGKSVFLAMRCVLDVLQGRNYLVVRKVGRTLRASCWNEIEKAINRLHIKGCFSLNKTDMCITAIKNGAQILFAGLDDVEKIKSVTPRRGTLTDIWMEEATELEYTDYKQLEKRLRGASAHQKRLIISFNPIYKTHWLYCAFFSNWQEDKRFLSESDLFIQKTTYRDNRFLSEDDRAALENERDDYYYNVYTLGNWGALGDVIFKNWHVEDLSEKQTCADRFYYGLDFGFSQDPCAMVKAALNRDKKQIYVFCELWQKGLTNDVLACEVRKIAGEGYVTCDSAEPRSIRELKMRGVRAVPAKKGADSVLHGLQWLNQHEIIIDVSCVKLKQELTLYQWRKDKNGDSLREPEDKNNHLIDALRYAFEQQSLMRMAHTTDREEFFR